MNVADYQRIVRAKFPDAVLVIKEWPGARRTYHVQAGDLIIGHESPGPALAWRNAAKSPEFLADEA